MIVHDLPSLAAKTAALLVLASHLLSSRSFAHGWVSNAAGPSNSRITRPTHLAMSKGKTRGESQVRTDEFLQFINEPMPTTVDSTDIVATPELDDLAPFVRTIVGAADKRKAENIVALRVSKVTAMTCFLVVVSGNSRPQNNAIAAAIMDDVEEEWDGRRTKGGGAEGTADSGWILLDYGDVMVHVMTPKSRLFYDVEGQWSEKGGEDMNLDDVLLVAPNAVEGQEGDAELGGGMGGLAEEEDPFWS